MRWTVSSGAMNVTTRRQCYHGDERRDRSRSAMTANSAKLLLGSFRLRATTRLHSGMVLNPKT
jgi:hypothetical protein